jgi:hypothetical protein
MDTVDKWADIIGVVLHFQNTMNGVSPSNVYIAKQTGMSGGQVGYHLKRMQERGLVEDDGEWPRHIKVLASKVQSQPKLDLNPNPQVFGKTEVKTVESTDIGAGTGKRQYNRIAARRSFLDRAREFAEILMDHYDKHGEAPYLKDVAAQMGYAPRSKGSTKGGSTTGGLSRVVQEMTRRGWLHHRPGHQRDMVLTGLGRAVLFGVDEEVHTDMPVQPQQRKVSPMATAFPNPNQPDVTIRRAEPPIPMRAPEAPVSVAPPTFTATGHPDLSNVDTVDLLLELQSRGLKVSR